MLSDSTVDEQDDQNNEVQVRSSDRDEAAEKTSPLRPGAPRIIEESQFGLRAGPVGKLVTSHEQLYSSSLTTTPEKKDNHVVDDTPITGKRDFDAHVRGLPSVSPSERVNTSNDNLTAFKKPVFQPHNTESLDLLSSPTRSPQIYSTAPSDSREAAMTTPGNNRSSSPGIKPVATSFNTSAVEDSQAAPHEPVDLDMADPDADTDNERFENISSVAASEFHHPHVNASVTHNGKSDPQDADEGSSRLTEPENERSLEVSTGSEPDPEKESSVDAPDNGEVNDLNSSSMAVGEPDEIDARTTNAPTSSSVAKKGPGRPSKSRSKSPSKASLPANTPAASFTPAPLATPASTEVKRGRGRPKKTPASTNDSNVAPLTPLVNDSATKRGRGRPRKDATAAVVSTPMSTDNGGHATRKRKANSASPAAATLTSKKTRLNSSANIASAPQTRLSPRTATVQPSTGPKSKTPKTIPHRLAFSNSTIPDRPAIMKFLLAQPGFTIVKSPTPDNYDALLVGAGLPLPKTHKLLMTVALGKPVISDAWLRDSVTNGSLLPTAAYLPVSAGGTKKQITSPDLKPDNIPRNTLMRNKTLFITPALKREYAREYANVPSLASLLSVRAVICKPLRSIDPAPTDVILGSQKETDPDAIGLMERGLAVFTKQMLSMSILRGELDIESEEFRMREPAGKSGKVQGKSAPAGQVKQAGGAKRGVGRPKKLGA
ncbi:MAG: hypothetical protein M1828_006556 [Chrysothrix sp. TS-e1954]|nr:MAG: hypothetical protein M1828_006556 [Chrysothrix sp. TS-e1954]